MNQTISNIVAGVCICVAVWAFFSRGTEIRIVEKPITVSLSKAQLDSMELAIRARVKGEMKPIVLPPKKILDSAGLALRDSIIKAQLNEIISLKGGLIGEAELKLSWEGLVGKYNDSLGVVADFISDSMFVNFRPNPREFSTTIKDTIETNYLNIWHMLGLVGVGVALDRILP